MVKRYGELYRDARRLLRGTEGENADLAARELLMLLTGKSAEALLADRELYASEEIEERLHDAIARMIAGEPLAYVLGTWSFCGMELTVSPDVLIPRDDTMAVTELSVQALSETEGGMLRVLDLGTGSGCIGLAIAKLEPRARVTLADISPEALRIAKKNLNDQKLTGRVTTFELDMKKPLPKFLGQFDLIVSNPPYVTRAEMQRLEPSVRFYEPHLALDGGEDGLDFYRAIAQNAAPALKEGGSVCLEFGMGQEQAVASILRAEGFTDLQFREDWRGIVRAVRAKK